MGSSTSFCACNSSLSGRALCTCTVDVSARTHAVHNVLVALWMCCIFSGSRMLAEGSALAGGIMDLVTTRECRQHQPGATVEAQVVPRPSQTKMGLHLVDGTPKNWVTVSFELESTGGGFSKLSSYFNLHSIGTIPGRGKGLPSLEALMPPFMDLIF